MSKRSRRTRLRHDGQRARQFNDRRSEERRAFDEGYDEARSEVDKLLALGRNFSLVQELGHLWEGVPGWRPVLSSVETMMKVPPAAEVFDVLSLSGDSTYPAADVVSVSELVAFQTVPAFARARPIWIGPTQLRALPDWGDEDEHGLSRTALDYASDARLPFPTIYLDFTDASGGPAWLPYMAWHPEELENPAALHVRSGDWDHVRLRVPHTKLELSLYGALIFRADQMTMTSKERRMALFGDDSLVIMPFGSEAKLDDDERRSPLHLREHVIPARGHIALREWNRDKDGYLERVPVPREAATGYMQLGGRLPGGEHDVGDGPYRMLGSAYFSGNDPDERDVRPMFALITVQPIPGGYVAEGTGDHAAAIIRNRQPLRLGHWPVSGEADLEDVHFNASLINWRVMHTLRALYLLQSVNVELVPAGVSRQVRRNAERRGAKIAHVVHIRQTQSRRFYVPSGRRANYSHSFERRGGYWHVTRGPHVRNPDKLAPCPEWRERHPWSEVCRREYHGPTLIDAGEGKPIVLKTREWNGRAGDEN
jgi:hypothetical protein